MALEKFGDLGKAARAVNPDRETNDSSLMDEFREGCGKVGGEVKEYPGSTYCKVGKDLLTVDDDFDSAQLYSGQGYGELRSKVTDVSYDENKLRVSDNDRNALELGKGKSE